MRARGWTGSALSVPAGGAPASAAGVVGPPVGSGAAGPEGSLTDPREGAPASSSAAGGAARVQWPSRVAVHASRDVSSREAAGSPPPAEVSAGSSAPTEVSDTFDGASGEAGTSSGSGLAFRARSEVSTPEVSDTFDTARPEVSDTFDGTSWATSSSSGSTGRAMSPSSRRTEPEGVDVPSVLLGDRVTHAQRQAFEKTFRWHPL